MNNNVYKDPGSNYVTMVWEGYHNSVTFREGTERMLNELLIHSSGKVLADIESMEMIGMEDQEWLLKDFLPRAINAGFNAIAIVKPRNYFNKVAVETVAYKVDQAQLRIRFFSDRFSASEWLSTC